MTPDRIQQLREKLDSGPSINALERMADEALTSLELSHELLLAARSQRDELQKALSRVLAAAGVLRAEALDPDQLLLSGPELLVAAAVSRLYEECRWDPVARTWVRRS